MIPKLRQFVTFATVLLLFSCASVPSLPVQSDSAIVPDQFATMQTTSVDVDEITVDWWRSFNDPVLTDLITQALKNNRELAVAEANIATAEALLKARSIGLSPSTLATANGEYGQPAIEDADTEFSGNSQLSASWELDVFGRLRAQIRAAEYDVDAFQELRRDLAVVIASETALAYADMRGNQVRLSVAQSNADLQAESLKLLETLFDNGRATRLDMERATSQYRTTLASLPVFEADIKRAGIRLANLTGVPNTAYTDQVSSALQNTTQIPLAPASLSVGTPESMIRRRPDIRAAEAEIASLLALSESERARLFPTLTFNANVLALFSDRDGAADTYGFGIGPAIRWEGPDLRRVRADIAITDARTRAAIAAYESEVITALGELELALIGYTTEIDRQADLEAAAASARRAVDLARLRFEEGLDDFLDVIDAQRTLLDTQDRLEASRLEATRQAIATYRALGGMWTTDMLDQNTPVGDLENAL
jgi:multidrug efflux system outer membrane protein